MRNGSRASCGRRAAALFAAHSLAALTAASPAVPSAPPEQSAVAITLGRPVEATLAPGEIHRYQVPARAARCVKVIATQVGIDIRLTWRAPERGGATGGGATGGGAIEEDVRSSGDEVLIAIPTVDGPHGLTVAAANDKAPPGRYRLAIEAPPDAACDPAARRHIEARALAARGGDQMAAARRGFIAARDAWQEAGDEAMAAYCLVEFGRLSKRMSELPVASKAYKEAADRYARLARAADQAAALAEMGEALFVEGDYRAALDAWRPALDLEPTLTRADRVALRYHYGSTLKELGRYEESLAAVEQAIGEFHALGDTAQELLARAELGSIHVMRHDPARALEALTYGVALSQEAGRPEMEARFLQRLGIVYWDAGDEEAAAESWRRALALHQDAGNRIGEAAVLLQLGDHARRQDEPATAEATYRQALGIFIAAGSVQGEARALNRLGLVLAKRGEYATAAEIQEKSLAINRQHGDRQGEVLALLNLGRTRAAAGDRAEARRLLTTALALSRESGAGIAEPDILGEMALLDRDEGATTQALVTLDQIIRIFESRQRAALVPSLKTTLGSDAQPWYAARTDILMRRHLTTPDAGWDARAFESAEQARARALLGLLAESRVDVRKGVDPALLEQYRVLQAELSAAEATGARGVKALGGGEAPAAGEAAPPDPRVADLSGRLQALEAGIRTSSPAYAGLTQPVPLRLESIRERVLDGDTVLLEYALGEKRSWMWAVSKDDLISAPLPPAAEIERVAQRLFERLSARPAAGAAAAGAAATIDGEAADLGRILLGPIASRLRGPWRDRRLAVVAPGALEYIPFVILPVPAPPGGPPAGTRRLIDDHEIVGLPSASVLDLLRRQVRERRPAPGRLAILGDPVFAADDPRVRAAAGATATATAAATALSIPAAMSTPAAQPASLSREALASTGTRGFPRLAFSRDEARAIAALLPEADVLTATDFRASRALAMDGTLGRYRIVHIATHGLLNTTHPELSGLVLSLVDESGRPQDGFLRLQDIYNLDLSADLVVLSACRTALGRRVAGEGLVGLARGFMYAGAPRVVASLWQVDDSATAELMTAFYRGLLNEGLRPAAALRAAQRRLAAQPRSSAPFFWAGFTLQGDWR